MTRSVTQSILSQLSNVNVSTAAMPKATISKVYEERQLRLKTCHGRSRIVLTKGFPCCRMFSVDIVFAQIVLRRSAHRFQQVAVRNVRRVLLVTLNIARDHSESHPTRAIHAEGRAQSRKCKQTRDLAPQPLRVRASRVAKK